MDNTSSNLRRELTYTPTYINTGKLVPKKSQRLDRKLTVEFKDEASHLRYEGNFDLKNLK